MIAADSNRCLRCGGCVGVCPVNALDLTEHGISCSESCTSCGSCMNFCPLGAIRLVKNPGEGRE